MTTINPSALVAAQVYGAASQPLRPAAPERKAPEGPKFQVEDQVTLRSAEPRRAPAQAPEATGTEASAPAPEKAPARPKRPGSLVDIKA